MKLFIAACLLAVSLAQTDSTNSDVYRHCIAPEHYELGPKCDHTILTGTTCNIYFTCPENMFSNPVSWTCQEDGTWTGGQPDPNCYDINCPDQDGYQAFETGGCSGQYQLGTFFGSLEECAQRCHNEITCVSFEFSKPWDSHPEPNRCALSPSCTYDLSRQAFNDQNCLYVKGLNISSHDSTHSGSSGGPGPPFIHCPIPTHYSSTCDGTIIVGTTCELFYLCPERKWSKRVPQTCQENTEWHDMPSLDPNCYPDESEEPSISPTQNPFPQITPSPSNETTDDLVASDSRDNSTSKDMNQFMIVILVLVGGLVFVGLVSVILWLRFRKWRNCWKSQIKPGPNGEAPDEVPNGEAPDEDPNGEASDLSGDNNQSGERGPEPGSGETNQGECSLSIPLSVIEKDRESQRNTEGVATTGTISPGDPTALKNQDDFVPDGHEATRKDNQL